ncbi:MAG: hypothetical protein HOP21_08970 [Methylotenera sp.]|nr:hypothetical protein [Methylotenera sp.]
MLNLILESLLTCPQCDFKKLETMPTNSCQFLYECMNCKSVFRPKPRDCCVFCSYGTVKCPSKQESSKRCCNTSTNF